jgi:lipopolysaccharide transport system ATP-binding protein
LSYTTIKVQSLAKQYKIGTPEPRYKTLGESISAVFGGNYLKRFGKRVKNEPFWALKDVSFEVKQGETVGIIGHNGAGKSTLLKVLSRITEPSAGTIDIYGRVGSLLEVGTGFHLELTGRENIYLSGAIMGMKKHDIARRFDEIVSFAAVEKFVDTPVKHYSSGMHLRLAFAVAAHLEPDILLVDEVLAVGDMDFQKRCLNKMETVSKEGRTVLFVSHNMGSIKELCKTALVLKNGSVDFHGAVVAGIRHYSRNILNLESADAWQNQRTGWRQMRINDETADARVYNNASFDIKADLLLADEISQVVVHCIMENSEGAQIAHNYMRLSDSGIYKLAAGSHQVKARMPPIYLKPGVYTIYLKLIGETANLKQIRQLSERIVLDVTDQTKLFTGKVHAAILPPVEWSIAPLENGSQPKKSKAISTLV